MAEAHASRELPYEAFQHIAAYSRQKGIAFFATAHDGPSLEFLESLNPPAYKIGSGEVYNWDFIARAAAKGKPLIVSTGMYDWAAVDELARCLQGAGNPEVVVLHCVTQYPTPPAEVNLRAMDALRQRLGCLVGYSDHTKGFHICLAAVARGACLLEKHISLDFNLPDAQDWKVSCGPHDLAEMISQMREVEQSLGVEEKFASPGEQASLQWARKSLVAARELPAGTVLEEAMLVAGGGHGHPSLAERGAARPANPAGGGGRSTPSLGRPRVMPRKVCIAITTRGNYAKMKSVIRAIEARPGLELQIVAGGMAILPRFGNTAQTMRDNHFRVDREVHFLVEGENPAAMAKSGGLAVIEFATLFGELKPDVVVVIADRFECLAIAMAASYLNIPLAHVEGGEISGSVDECIRHAITKLSHLHFPANPEAAQRIVRLGEDPATVFTVGPPAWTPCASWTWRTWPPPSPCRTSWARAPAWISTSPIWW